MKKSSYNSSIWITPEARKRIKLCAIRYDLYHRIVYAKLVNKAKEKPLIISPAKEKTARCAITGKTKTWKEIKIMAAQQEVTMSNMVNFWVMTFIDTEGKWKP